MLPSLVEMHRGALTRNNGTLQADAYGSYLNGRRKSGESQAYSGSLSAVSAPGVMRYHPFAAPSPSPKRDMPPSGPVSVDSTR